MPKLMERDLNEITAENASHREYAGTGRQNNSATFQSEDLEKNAGNLASRKRKKQQTIDERGSWLCNEISEIGSRGDKKWIRLQELFGDVVV